MAALLPIIAHAAGETSARPQVHVVSPPAAAKEDVEPDDLPGPPLEEGTGTPAVRLPAIPDFPSAPGRAPAASAPVTVVTHAPERRIVTLTARNLSIDALNRCNDAITQKRFAAAIAACRSSIAAWQGNHLAWYAAANAHVARDEWKEGAASLAHAVALRPDIAMYQMMYGIALYEAEVERFRQERMHRAAGKPGEDGEASEGADAAGDAPVLHLDAARAALVRAATIAPTLWRTHSYLGLVYRDLRDPRAAAEELTAALRGNPLDRPSYVALTELYRRAGFTQQALAVAGIGVTNIPGSAELWFEVAMSYEALRDGDRAIEALTRGLAVSPESMILKLQRGRLHVARHHNDLARRDLEPLKRLTDPRWAPIKEAAALFLSRLGGGETPQDAYRVCKALNGCKIFKDVDQVWLIEDWSTL
jgi:tetratricopeptide (TPR) repeat protein